MPWYLSLRLSHIYSYSAKKLTYCGISVRMLVYVHSLSVSQCGCKAKPSGLALSLSSAIQKSIIKLSLPYPTASNSTVSVCVHCFLTTFALSLSRLPYRLIPAHLLTYTKGKKINTCDLCFLLSHPHVLLLCLAQTHYHTNILHTYTHRHVYAPLPHVLGFFPVFFFHLLTYMNTHREAIICGWVFALIYTLSGHFIRYTCTIHYNSIAINPTFV